MSMYSILTPVCVIRMHDLTIEVPELHYLTVRDTLVGLMIHGVGWSNLSARHRAKRELVLGM